MVKGMTTCKVCGRDFALIIEEHYTSRDDERRSGLVSAITGREESQEFDTFDCPHCGCQNRLQQRMRRVCPCDYGICDECTEDDREEDEEDE